MKTVYDHIEPFAITGVKPGALTLEDAFETITEKSFQHQWKVIVYYPKDFTFVCPTEIGVLLILHVMETVLLIS